MKIFKHLLLGWLLAALILAIAPLAKAAPINELEVVMFTRNGCVHCAAMEAKLSTLQQNGFPQIKLVEYEVFEKPENQQLFEQYSRAFGFTIVGVPVTLIGDQFIEGEDTKQLEALIRSCQQKTCPAPTELIKSIDTTQTTDTTTNNLTTIIGWFIIGGLGVAIIGYIAYKLIKKSSL